MQIELLGSIGIGLVWGWCLGFWNAGVPNSPELGLVDPASGTLRSVEVDLALDLKGVSRRWLNAAASVLASLLLAALVQSTAGPRAVVYFAVSAALSITVHIAWRAHLRRRVAA